MKLYKYKKFPITNEAQELASDEGVKGLFEGAAWASSRKYFNDPFDAHINYTIPTAAELKALTYQLSEQERLKVKAWVSNGRITDEFAAAWQKMMQDFDTIVDSYAIYCFASEPDNNILWSHYANNHTSYCIELESLDFEYTHVNYQNTLPEIAGIDLIKAFNNIDAERVSKSILNGLNTKLMHWQIENELRHIAKDKLPLGEKGRKILFPNNSITGIIFGCYVNPRHQSYIIKNFPHKTNFKKAIIDKKSSRIVIESLSE
ncbi:MAG: hypothetical protein WC782_13880 [Methylococcaceae bacterium]|jgi:hypothetical protein